MSEPKGIIYKDLVKVKMTKERLSMMIKYMETKLQVCKMVGEFLGDLEGTLLPGSIENNPIYNVFHRLYEESKTNLEELKDSTVQVNTPDDLQSTER